MNFLTVGCINIILYSVVARPITNGASAVNFVSSPFGGSVFLIT